MKTEIREGARLAAAIAARRTPSSALPEDVRREAIAYTRRRLAAGASQATIARELAVTIMTVSRWAALAKTSAPAKPPRPAPELRRVRVVATATKTKLSRAAIVVTTASGLRVEGLSAADVLSLLRAIG